MLLLTVTFNRFVLFAFENESGNKFFADKLGLETDWNCSISLKEKMVTADRDPFENSTHGDCRISITVIVNNNNNNDDDDDDNTTTTSSTTINVILICS